MVKYFARECSRRCGYVSIVLRKPGPDAPLQAVNGHCFRDSCRLASIAIEENRVSSLQKVQCEA